MDRPRMAELTRLLYCWMPGATVKAGLMADGIETGGNPVVGTGGTRGVMMMGGPAAADAAAPSATTPVSNAAAHRRIVNFMAVLRG